MKTKIDLSKIKFRTKNRAELRAYRELTSQGYEVLKRGWPDLIATRGMELRFIEVKDSTGKLKVQQVAVAEILSGLGIEVEVWGNGKATNSRSWREDLKRVKKKWLR